MTWAEFKDAVEQAGVNDSTLIKFIDITNFDFDPSQSIHWTAEGQVEIW